MARIGQKSSRWVNFVLPSAASSSSGPPAMQQNATKCNTFSLLALFPASKPQPMQENVRPQALHRPIHEAPLSRRPRRTCLRTSPNFQRTMGPHPNVLRRSGRKLFPTQIVIHTFGFMSSGRNDFFPRAPRPGRRDRPKCFSRATLRRLGGSEEFPGIRRTNYRPINTTASSRSRDATQLHGL